MDARIKRGREMTKEEIRAYNREYYMKNREKYLKKAKEYREHNKEACHYRNNKWRVEHKDKHNERNKVWVSSHKNQQLESQRQSHRKAFCKNFQDIENYEKAKADNFKGWHIHHRLETHTSNGNIRLIPISRDELIALDMYYDRPANELIFMKSSDHTSLHNMARYGKL